MVSKLRHPVTNQIPEHLTPFIAKQDPSLYTPMDHASWRFILRISKAFFAKNAHEKYLTGLKETGISTERIPLIEEMDTRLRSFGWRAVPVSGFIPPAVFMEFQSLGILPIACEMRTLEHLAYTPAPDIVHEAAGHAPIIADQEYADYLRSYGEISRKAIFSDKDMAVYEAIRELSDLKENPKSTPDQIDAAQKRLDQASGSVDYISEATYLSRMNWWTVEYGLVGTLEQPKIYGAGLLSSVGESYHCLNPNVKKLPLTMDCIQINYDITREQPQLFVTPSFPKLTQILEEFAKTMAFRQGGRAGLEKAKKAATTTTAVLDSGLQISGTLADFKCDERGNPIFIRFQGPTQLAYHDAELENQGPKQHAQGFSTPVGPLDSGKSASELLPTDLVILGFRGKEKGTIRFKSGVELTGSLKGTTSRGGKTILLSFENCKITLGEEVLFQPEWGTFDLACGLKVVSVFGGAADRVKYLAATGMLEQKPNPPKSNLTAENSHLNELYAQVRKLRESGLKENLAAALSGIHGELEKNYKQDWLLRLELLELNRTHNLSADWEKAIRLRLSEIASSAKDKAELISRGLEIL